VKTAYENLEHRRPVWEALSDLFLDTDISLTRAWRVGILAASPYSIEELEEILVDEVYPVCGFNLCSVAGEWAGFDPEGLESSILRHLRSPLHRWRRFSLTRLMIPLPQEWRFTKAAVLRQRA
jgi:hypothetical protein